MDPGDINAMADLKVADVPRGEAAFGLSYTRFSIPMMRQILSGHHEYFSGHWTKSRFWVSIQNLQRRLWRDQTDRITAWVAAPRRTRGLYADHVDKIAYETRRNINARQPRMRNTERQGHATPSQAPSQAPKATQEKESSEAVVAHLMGQHMIDIDSNLNLASGSKGVPPVSPKTIDCEVCTEPLPTDSFPEENITAGCEHAPRVCLRCLRRHIKSEIQRGSWAQLGCPQCPELLDFTAVQKFASEASFARYDNLISMDFMRNDPNFTMCLGPNCGSGQIHFEGDEQPIMTCGACRFKTCFTHKTPWHSSQTCANYDASQQTHAEQEAASAKLLKKETKPCPSKQCGIHIQQWGGCDHMTCYRCGFQFCWVCLAPWARILEAGNHHHRVNCRHYYPYTEYRGVPQAQFDTIWGSPVARQQRHTRR